MDPETLETSPQESPQDSTTPSPSPSTEGAVKETSLSVMSRLMAGSPPEAPQGTEEATDPQPPTTAGNTQPGTPQLPSIEEILLDPEKWNQVKAVAEALHAKSAPPPPPEEKPATFTGPQQWAQEAASNAPRIMLSDILPPDLMEAHGLEDSCFNQHVEAVSVAANAQNTAALTDAILMMAQHVQELQDRIGQVAPTIETLQQTEAIARAEKSVEAAYAKEFPEAISNPELNEPFFETYKRVIGIDDPTVVGNPMTNPAYHLHALKMTAMIMRNNNLSATPPGPTGFSPPPQNNIPRPIYTSSNPSANTATGGQAVRGIDVMRNLLNR